MARSCMRCFTQQARVQQWAGCGPSYFCECCYEALLLLEGDGFRFGLDGSHLTATASAVGAKLIRSTREAIGALAASDEGIANIVLEKLHEANKMIEAQQNFEKQRSMQLSMLEKQRRPDSLEMLDYANDSDGSWCLTPPPSPTREQLAQGSGLKKSECANVKKSECVDEDEDDGDYNAAKLFQFEMMRGNMQDCLVVAESWQFEGRYMMSAAESAGEFKMSATLFVTAEDVEDGKFEKYKEMYAKLKEDFLRLKEFVMNADENNTPKKAKTIDSHNRLLMID